MAMMAGKILLRATSEGWKRNKKECTSIVSEKARRQLRFDFVEFLRFYLRIFAIFFSIYVKQKNGGKNGENVFFFWIYWRLTHKKYLLNADWIWKKMITVILPTDNKKTHTFL